ncbi:MAG: peptidoglycan-binding protein [Spirochaetaceae bacterium]|jgi:hypothetical protein|nr:peptidoglycan-binding protein [Spirochaetaceae bacterium]
MNCNEVLDALYYSDGGIPLVKRIFIAFHIWRCPKCAAHADALQKVSACREDFFPPASGIADSVMALIREGGALVKPANGQEALSIRAWAAAGLAILVSVSSAYLGIDYLTPVDIRTANLMLPVGITVGCVVTAFGAIFIGCHIKELSAWLGLNSGSNSPAANHR